MTSTSITFDAKALQDAEEEEMENDDFEQQEELRQILTEGLGDLSDNESGVSGTISRSSPNAELHAQGEHWHHTVSNQLDKEHYIYQGNEYNVWNGHQLNEELPWPTSQWITSYPYNALGTTQRFAPLYPDNDNAATLSTGQPVNTVINQVKETYLNDAHPGDHSESVYAYQTLSGEEIDESYARPYFLESNHEHEDITSNGQENYHLLQTRALAERFSVHDIDNQQQWPYQSENMPLDNNARVSASEQMVTSSSSANVQIWTNPENEDNHVWTNSIQTDSGYVVTDVYNNSNNVRLAVNSQEEDSHNWSNLHEGKPTNWLNSNEDNRQLLPGKLTRDADIQLNNIKDDSTRIGPGRVQLHYGHSDSSDWNDSIPKHFPSSDNNRLVPDIMNYQSASSQAYRVNYNRPSGEPGQQQTYSDNLQEEFLNPGDVSALKQRWSQLEILYKRRGEDLEELRSQLKLVTEEKDKEIRILNHRLTLLQGEKESLTDTNKQCQLVVSQTQSSNVELNGRIIALQKTIDALKISNDELNKKLETAESCVETLNAQLQAMGQSDSLSRARQQHEAIVNSLTQKMDSELNTLREKLDIAEKDRDEKESDVMMLRAQLTKLQKAQDATMVEHSTTVTRLMKNIEELRQQLLAKPDSTIEIANLRQKLREIESEKELLEKSRISLESVVKELKMQNISLASRNGRPVNSMNDSYSELAIKQPSQSNRDMPSAKTIMDKSRDIQLSERATQTLQTDNILKETLVRVEADVERLEAINAELKKQMAAQVNEADKDKQLALDRCEKVWREHLTETSHQIQQAAEQKVRDEVKVIEDQKQREIQTLRNSLADIQRQLDETKELYITMCHEKDQLEEKTTKSGDLLNANMERKNAEKVKQQQTEIARLQRLLEEKQEQLKVKEEEHEKVLRATYEECDANMKQLQEEHQKALQQVLKQARNKTEESKASLLQQCEIKSKAPFNRSYCDKIVQTDASDSATSDEMKAQYLTTLQNIKSRVIQHLATSGAKSSKLLVEEMNSYRLSISQQLYAKVVRLLGETEAAGSSEKNNFRDKLRTELQSFVDNGSELEATTLNRSLLLQESVA